MIIVDIPFAQSSPMKMRAKLMSRDLFSFVDQNLESSLFLRLFFMKNSGKSKLLYDPNPRNLPPLESEILS